MFLMFHSLCFIPFRFVLVSSCCFRWNFVFYCIQLITAPFATTLSLIPRFDQNRNRANWIGPSDGRTMRSIGLRHKCCGDTQRRAIIVCFSQTHNALLFRTTPFSIWVCERRTANGERTICYRQTLCSLLICMHRNRSVRKTWRIYFGCELRTLVTLCGRCVLPMYFASIEKLFHLIYEPMPIIIRNPKSDFAVFVCSLPFPS